MRPDVLSSWNAADRELVFRFFVSFSTFECALKRSGVLKRRKNEEPVAPDWSLFASSLKGRFGTVQDEAFARAIAFLESAPPRQQVIRGGRLAWAEQPQRSDETLEAYILRLVRTVRNNLFHGGKYPAATIEEAARNRALLESCLHVLGICCQLKPHLSEWFEEAA